MKQKQPYTKWIVGSRSKPLKSGRPKTNLEPTYDVMHSFTTKYSYKKLLHVSRVTINGVMHFTVVGQLADGTVKKELIMLKTHD